MGKKSERDIPTYKEAIRNKKRIIEEADEKRIRYIRNEAISEAYEYTVAFERGIEGLFSINGENKSEICAQAAEILRAKGYSVECKSCANRVCLFSSDSTNK
jgi:hypothetical protein